MIKMSMDKETVLPHEPSIKGSPVFPSAITLSEQQKLSKPHPLCTKNGLELPGNSQPLLPAPPPPPAQRIGKRRYSMGIGFKGLAKRRRRANSDSQSEPVLPSHFLLGGNIFDPLNLNSLLDEDVNRVTNQETPKCSPLPSRGRDPVEILVPRDITDPLNLKGGSEDGQGGAGVLLSPVKSRRRHRNRHHGGGGGKGEGEKDVIPAPLFPSTAGLPAVPLLTREGSIPPSPLPCELNTAITCRDDVAPPPILPRRHTHPPPGHSSKASNLGEGRHRRRRRTTSTRSADGTATAVTMGTTAQSTKFQTPLVGGAKTGRCGGPQPGATQPPEKKKDKHRYQYGNHSHYYGFHGFYGNKWEGRVGEDEDPRLRLLEADWFRDKAVLDVGCGTGHMTLSIARRFNPTHILGVELDKRLVQAAIQNIRHFLSHDLVVEERRGKGDYVSEREVWPGQGQYDVIMCLGVTKWVQLQSGDAGVVRLFKRAYQSLSPGGLFILEPQPWSRYSHSKRASETTYRNYRSLKLRPEQFTSYLTDSIGFTSYRLLTHTGNQRPIYLFHKGSAQRK
ncbi:7SK snRNA methylphosphate capping enzyme [Channa argus]|uniref:RNA methyltransferase n=1 Tax=Channa argus TaxID=215402 RepID=A0A6G1Q716_CHAAH|nr:7SK snRNA methylphosphate capping enzyme [Channa argus]